MTEEQLQAKREYNNLRYHNMTPEQRQEKNKRQHANRIKRIGFRDKERARGKVYRASLSLDQKKAKLVKNNESRRQREANNPTDWREHHLQRNYGLTLEAWNAMLESQNGCCAICKEKPNGNQPFNVDHNHVTDKVRAILCTPCNTAIGKMKDSPVRLRAAADYLERY